MECTLFKYILKVTHLYTEVKIKENILVEEMHNQKFVSLPANINYGRLEWKW